jgi:hypothetical protein
MKERVGASDRVSFVLNGKPIRPSKPVDYCPEKLKPGGCQQHNLQCSYPECNRPPKK